MWQGDLLQQTGGNRPGGSPHEVGRGWQGDTPQDTAGGGSLQGHFKHLACKSLQGHPTHEAGGGLQGNLPHEAGGGLQVDSSNVDAEGGDLQGDFQKGSDVGLQGYLPHEAGGYLQGDPLQETGGGWQGGGLLGHLQHLTDGSLQGSPSHEAGVGLQSELHWRRQLFALEIGEMNESIKILQESSNIESLEYLRGKIELIKKDFHNILINSEENFKQLKDMISNFHAAERNVLMKKFQRKQIQSSMPHTGNDSDSEISQKSQDQGKKSYRKAQKRCKKCPLCKKYHNYRKVTRRGQIFWPSQRLTSCPVFMDSSSDDQKSTIANFNICEMCLSWNPHRNCCRSNAGGKFLSLSGGVFPDL